MSLRKLNAGLLIVLFAFSATGTASVNPTSAFDRFGDINCENEMARLDNFTIQLQNEPAAQGLIIFYGGQRFRGRLPRRGEAAARAARLKPYMVQRRGLSSDRVRVIDGGYREEWLAELWIVPPGLSPPTPNPTVSANQIRFRKGKVSSRTFRCQI